MIKIEGVTTGGYRHFRDFSASTIKGLNQLGWGVWGRPFSLVRAESSLLLLLLLGIFRPVLFPNPTRVMLILSHFQGANAGIFPHLSYFLYYNIKIFLSQLFRWFYPIFGVFRQNIAKNSIKWPIFGENLHFSAHFRRYLTKKRGFYAKFHAFQRIFSKIFKNFRKFRPSPARFSWRISIYPLPLEINEKFEQI